MYSTARISAALALAAGLLTTATVQAVPIDSPFATLGGPAIDFEGRGEGELIDTQFAGVTFGQDDGGRPMIDNSPFLFGYMASSGVGVLTGSTEGGAPFPTVAGLELTFDDLVGAVEFFLSDTAPLGDYTIEAFGDGGLLESFTIALADVEAGQWVGFTRGGGDIRRVTVDSSIEGDAFSIDDVRFEGAAPVPAPAALSLMGLGLIGLAAGAKRRNRV